jgi:hypothetical protein
MSEISDATDDYASSMTEEWYKEMEAAKAMKDMKDVMLKVMKGTAKYQQKMANHVSDLCKSVSEMEKKLTDTELKAVKQKEKIEEFEKLRETSEVKASRKDMAEKMELATTQVKILDMDFDKQTDVRKELLDVAKVRLLAKVKAAEQAKFTELIKKGVVQVLAKKTMKRKSRQTGEDIWTAPIVLTMKEKESRWEMEDLLRRNKIYPTFHWPKEFLEPMKKMREQLKTKVDEETHYVRMRPFQQDGKWKVKVDVKPKEGDGRFETKATWEVPPADPEIRKKAND